MSTFIAEYQQDDRYEFKEKKGNYKISDIKNYIFFKGIMVSRSHWSQKVNFYFKISI